MKYPIPFYKTNIWIHKILRAGGLSEVPPEAFGVISTYK